MVNNVMNTTPVAAIMKTKGVMLMRYANFCSQLLISHHDTGRAIASEIKVSRKNSFDSIVVTFTIDAPTTFLMAISFLLFCAVNAARPNKPRHEITIAKPAKYFDSTDTLDSDSYCF